MSTAEIFILVLMGIIALQMLFFYQVIQSSLETMRGCSETSDQAYNLALRVLDDARDDAEASEIPPAYRETGDQRS